MEIMAKLNSQVLRAAGIALIALLAALGNMVFGWSEATIADKGAHVLDLALNLFATGSVIWAIVARVNLPNPPLTEAAANAHTEILAKQGTPVVAAATGAPIAFTPTVSSPPPTARSPLIVALLIAVLLVGTILCSCATDPVSVAKTPGQKAAAALGEFNIYAAAALALAKAPNLPVNLRNDVLDAEIAAKPVADAADSALRLYRKASTDLAAGATTQDKVNIAAANLTSYLLQLDPLIQTLLTKEKAVATP